MKRIRFASCLMVLFLLVLNLEIALGQEQSGIDAIPQDFADHSIGAENADGGYVVNLEVDGGFLALTIPADYQYQPVELTEIERYTFTYTFTNEKTKTSFLVQSSLHTQKDQNHLLKKLYDRSNKFIVVSDGFLIGEHTYLIYTNEQATYGYGFLIRTDDGYSYQFHYILPYDTIQDEIPVEAISILSTLEIQESSEYTD